MNDNTSVQDQESIVARTLAQYGVLRPLLSYHFMEVKRTRNFKTELNGNFTTNYVWPATKDLNGPPSMVIVRDGLQKLFTGTDPSSRKKSYVDQPWAALDIARDLLKNNTGSHENSPSHDGPAFWISKATVFPRVQAQWDLWGTPEFEKQFPEFYAECVAYRARAYRFCERKVAEGNALHSEGKGLFITDIHRTAAHLIGSNAAETLWLNSSKQGDKIPCPLCGKPTSSVHPKCSECGDIINYALYEDIQRKLGKPGMSAAPAPPAAETVLPPPPAVASGGLKQPPPPPLTAPPAASQQQRA